MATQDQEGNAPAAVPRVVDLLAALQHRAWTEAVRDAATMMASTSSSSPAAATTTMETSSSSGSYDPSVTSLFAPRFCRAALRGELPASGCVEFGKSLWTRGNQGSQSIEVSIFPTSSKKKKKKNSTTTKQQLRPPRDDARGSPRLPLRGALSRLCL